jgi:hypothetical protein
MFALGSTGCTIVNGPPRTAKSSQQGAQPPTIYVITREAPQAAPVDVEGCQ